MEKKYKVFIDESWDHNLNISSLDGDYNIFVLAAVIFSEDNYILYDNMLRNIKKDLRGTDDIVLHTAEITRPNKSKDSRNLLFNDKHFRNLFYKKINNFLKEIDITIVTCIIDKSKLVKQYWSNAEDPYILSFENLINRILRSTWWGICEIFPEKRSHVEDIKLESMLLKLKTIGTAFYTGSNLQDRIVNFRFTNKKANESWSQIADIIASPIGRNYLNKKQKQWNEVEYSIIQNKIPIWWKTIFP